MEAHQGVLEVSHGVECPGLDQQSCGVDRLVELDQDDRYVLQSDSDGVVGGRATLTSRAASY